MVVLSEKQIQAIRKQVEELRPRLDEEFSSPEWQEDRHGRAVWVREILSQDHLPNLTPEEFGKLVRDLWASHIWTNRDYLVDKILSQNDFEAIQQAFHDLLYGDAPLSERFDRFNIKGLGPASITEILTLFDPTAYCIWNDKPKNVLPFLGLKTLIADRAFKYAIRGKDYVRAIEVQRAIQDVLRECGFPDCDLLDVDNFLWVVYDAVVKLQRREELPAVSEVEEREEEAGPALDDHWDAIAMLAQVGKLLGYDVYVADPARESRLFGVKLGDLADLQEVPRFTLDRYLDTISYVDVIWFQEEFPAYCFEVEHSTGVTQGLLRLYQIRRFTDACFFIVAPAKVESRFRSEVKKDPFHQIKDRYTFKSYDDLSAFYHSAKEYHSKKEAFLMSRKLYAGRHLQSITSTAGEFREASPFSATTEGCATNCTASERAKIGQQGCGNASREIPEMIKEYERRQVSVRYRS
jgi:hypothetical protein